MYLDAVQKAIDTIRAEDRYRTVDAQSDRTVADFSSNDYLGLAADSRMVEAMKYGKRVGSGGARLLAGKHREHALLEEDAARWTGRERALLFSSGYLAALGAITVLSQFVDAIYSDECNHASLIDGIRLARKPCEIFSHRALPPRSSRRTPALIVSETLFGMEGDLADVGAIVADLNDADVVLLDEAHALGSYGSEGSGLAAAHRDARIVVLGTLGKSIGAAGGFLAGPSQVVDLLVNSARTFIFDTAMPPPIAFAARVGILLARNARDRRERLRRNAERVRAALRSQFEITGEDTAPVVPVRFGSERAAIEAMNGCAERGLVVPAIRPPTVPPGTSRLRISLRADHTAEQIDLLAGTLLQCTAIS